MPHNIRKLLLLIIACMMLTACGRSTEQPMNEPDVMTVPEEKAQAETLEDETMAEDMSNETPDDSVNELQEEQADMGKLIIEVNGHRLVATLAENSSADALRELLAEGPVTVDMHDFSNFEKVGELPQELPRNDEQIDTDYGDLILYLGKRFVIYYDQNSWDFTRLGHIDDITQEELKSILGDGDVTAVLSMGE